MVFLASSLKNNPCGGTDSGDDRVPLRGLRHLGIEPKDRRSRVRREHSYGEGDREDGAFVDNAYGLVNAMGRHCGLLSSHSIAQKRLSKIASRPLVLIRLG